MPSVISTSLAKPQDQTRQKTSTAKEADDAALFRQAVSDARPLPQRGRIIPASSKPKPIPRQSELDAQQVLRDLLTDHIPWEEIKSGDELTFLRPGIAAHTLKRLRRGHWVIEQELDLHGFNRDAARAQLVEFLHQCKKRDIRCIRIIHGKGLRSPNKEPVLKQLVRNWLMQRDEVLAFTQARQVDGGSGAVIVMLKRGK